MEITKKMYELAKQIVEQYEGDDDEERIERIAKKMKAIFDKDNYNNPFKTGEIMPCCGERYCFSYAHMKYMPRNPQLIYRSGNSEGDVDFDPKSKNSRFVEYNNCREAIRQAKAKGYNHVHFRLSIAGSEAIKADGYIDHNDKLDTISWKKNFLFF